MSKITLSVQQIVSMQETLTNLANASLDDARIAYRLSKLILALDPDFKEFTKARQAIIRKYGEMLPLTDEQLAAGIKPGNEQYQQYRIPDDKVDIFNTEMKNLGEETVDVVWKPVSVDAFKPFKFSAAMLIILAPLLQDDEDDSIELKTAAE